tara:strand:- start:198 stop:386 length:189 start_codon:yes stop_codon:yes gene_type:complete
LFNIVFENIINIRLPKDIDSIFIKKPSKKPKKNPELIKIIIPPGNDKVKKQIEIMKYNKNEE